MADEEEEVVLREGMGVATEENEPLGKLAALLIPEDAEEDEAEFLLLTTPDGVERLVPFEAVLGVGDGNLILDVPVSAIEKFPKVREGQEPTDDEVELAYHVYEEHAAYEVDEDEE